MKLCLLIAFFAINIFSSVAQKNFQVVGRGKMPALAVDKSGSVHLVFGSGDSLLYSISSDQGQSFSTPQLVDTIEGLAASATRGPQVTISNNMPVVIAPTNGGNIWSYRKDRNTWIKSSRLNDVDSVNLEGFADVASDSGSNVFAVWLDLRGNKRNKLYGTSSSDGGKTWSRNIRVYESPDSTICECCRVSVAMNVNNVYVMFRNQLYGQRDLHIAHSGNGGETFGEAEKVGTGSWKLNGCPMDGGGLALADDGKIETVWRRESKIYACEPGKPEVEIGEGKSCTIEIVGGKNVYAFVKNGEIICRLQEGSFVNLGKGNSPALSAIGENNVMCVWENLNNIQSAILKVN